MAVQVADPKRRSGRLPWRTVVALAAGLTVGYLAGDLLPDVVDGLRSDFGMSQTASGALATGVLLATAVASVLVARRADRPGRVRVAVVGAALSVVGYGVAAAAPSTWILATAGIVAGAGAGAVLAASTSAVSATEDPDRASGASVLVNAAIGMVLLLAIPFLTGGRAPATFLVLAAVGAVLLPTLRWLPDTAGHSAAPRTRLPHLPVGLAVFAGTLLLDVTDNGMWAFAGTVGTAQSGMSEGVVGAVFSAGAVVGLAGAALQIALGNRIGRLLPLVVLVVLDTLVKVAFVTTTSPFAFTALELLWSFCYAALFAFLLAAGAALDGFGRWAALVAAAFAFGDALGPVLVGTVADAGGASAVAALNIAIGIAVAALLGAAGAWLDRHPLTG